MNISGRQLAKYLSISARTLGRFEEEGIVVRQPSGEFEVQEAITRLLKHFMIRERWAFQQLRRFRIFDELTGDRFESRERRSRQ